MNRKTFITGTVLGGLAFIGASRAKAQDPTDEDIKLFRKDIRSLRKQIIAANLDLSDEESEHFWPLFDKYTAELVAKQDGKYALLKEYAQKYTTMNSEDAENYIRGRAAIEEAIMLAVLPFVPERSVRKNDGSIVPDRLAARVGH